MSCKHSTSVFLLFLDIYCCLAGKYISADGGLIGTSLGGAVTQQLCHSHPLLQVYCQPLASILAASHLVIMNPARSAPPLADGGQ
jgi:hypothetical protein